MSERQYGSYKSFRYTYVYLLLYSVRYYYVNLRFKETFIYTVGFHVFVVSSDDYRALKAQKFLY